MDAIKFACQNCGGHIEADEDMGGDSAECPHCHRVVMIPMPGIHPGMKIAGYTVERKLGTGGMGEVWLANQVAMERQVALKILPPGLTRDETFVKRFIQEVKTSAKLTHPNMVAAFDAGVDKGIYYLAISYIEGEELDRRLRREGALPEKEALRIARAIAGALLYAWRKFGLLHRDIKPANIMIDKEGEALLMDMGIAKTLTSDESDMTLSGTFLGTPLYMSPEQGRGEEDIDFRADIYSLGATLYHLLTGEPPFRADSVEGILTKHFSEPLPPAQEKNPQVSNPCAALLEIMMAKNKNDRQQSWADVIRDIQRVLQGRFPQTPCPPGSALAGMQALSNQVQQGARSARLHAREPDAAAQRKSPALHTVIAVLSILAAVLIALGLLKRARSRRAAREEGIAARTEAVRSEPKPARPSPRDQQMKEAWEYAVQYADQAKKELENFDRAIDYFKRIQETYKGSRYDLMADEQIDDLQRARFRESSQVLKQLETRAQPLLKEKRFEDAASVYRDYRGPMHKETRTERMLRSDKIMKNSEKWAEEQQRRKEMQNQHKYSLLQALASELVRGRFLTALDIYEGSPHRELIEEVEAPLRELTDIRAILMDSFRDDVGRELTVMTERGPQRLRVTRVDDASIYVEQRVAGGVLEKTIALSELSPMEREQRLERMTPEARAILQAVKHIKERDAQAADADLAKAGILGTAMREQLTVDIAQNAEELARNRLNAILSEVDPVLEDRSVTDAVYKINRKTLTVDQAQTIDRAIREFRQAYGHTAVARDADPILAALERAVDFSLKAAP